MVGLFLCGGAFGKELPVLNRYVLAAVESMPTGKGYDASQRAVDRLAASVRVRNGVTQENLEEAGATFCSGATYVVWLRAIKMLQKNGAVRLSNGAVDRLAKMDVKDGELVFGRWNANGPGTAKLFAELGCGRNFTSWSAALPGDFMKIWWTDEIGGRERGHSVVYVGQDKGKVKFWSANDPGGYGEKWVSKEKVKRVLFSRWTRHDRLGRVEGLSGRNDFLRRMLGERFPWERVVRECDVRARP